MKIWTDKYCLSQTKTHLQSGHLNASAAKKNFPQKYFNARYTFLLRPRKKKYVCLRSADRPQFFAPTLNIFMALLVENYLTALFLPSNVVFDV